MAYLHLQDGGLTPTAGIEKQDYSHFVAETLTALNGYTPLRGYEELQAYCVATKSWYSWNGSNWTGLSTPVFALYSDLPAVAVNGQEALVNKLVGSGFFRVRYMASTSRWSVVAGECIASLNDPHSVVSATGITPVDVTVGALPANIWGDGEEYELIVNTETGVNTGSDSTGLYFGAYNPYATSIAASTVAPIINRYCRSSGILFRTVYAPTSAFITTIRRDTVDMTISRSIVLRITPATIGNTTYIRRFSIRRIS